MRVNLRIVLDDECPDEDLQALISEWLYQDGNIEIATTNEVINAKLVYVKEL